MQEELTYKLMKTFNVNTDQAARLLMELKQCVKRKNLVSISNFTKILCNFLRKGYITHYGTSYILIPDIKLSFRLLFSVALTAVTRKSN